MSNEEDTRGFDILSSGVSASHLDQLLTLTTEELKELQSRPEVVFSRFGRRIVETTFGLVVVWLQQAAERQTYETAMRTIFYHDYPDLVGHEGLVGEAAGELEAAHPELPRHMLLSLIAEKAREKLAGQRIQEQANSESETPPRGYL